MKNKLEENELFQASHMMILESYTIFSAILIAESLIMGWERWALVLVAAGMIISWILHIEQVFSNYGRLWIYSLLMMGTFFFYGIHLTSTYDLAIVICAVIFLYIMTGISSLVTLCQVTYYFTFIYDIIVMINIGENFDSLLITRSLLHLGMVTMIGWVGRTIINRWGEVMVRSHGEIKELKDATIRLNDFLANVSHEIRTPINAVIGLSDVCIEKEKDPDILSDMLSVNEAGKRVGNQISDILDYSEIDRKRLVNNCENYMISSVLHDLVTEIRSSLHPNTELIIDVNPSIPAVMYSDQEKIKKILWHLITNGIKYTHQGGVYARLDCIEEDYGINLCFEVTDTGVGMDDEQIEHIFDGFYQGDSGRTRTVNGLGLGMSIVSGFVSNLGGFTTLESRPGVGTTVRVSLPQKVVENTGCMSLRSRENLCIGAFLHFDKFPDPSVREYYNSMVKNIVKGLGVKMYRVDNLENLKKLNETVDLTHLFVGQEEFECDIPYFEELSNNVLVVVVAKAGYTVPEGSKVLIMEKPLYCFPVVSVLNMDLADRDRGEEKMMLRGVRALVVDDEPMNLTVADGIFRSYGMVVSTALSGFESIQMCKDNEYDVIFMDHMMPGMDGVETMKRIKGNRGKKDKPLPIIALTANAVSTAREMFISEGFDGFVSKPIDQTDLERALKRALPEHLIQYVENRPVPGQIRTELKAEISVSKKDDPEMPGINMKTGLSYCRKDMGFYKTLLSQFASEREEKKAGMKKALAACEAKNFEIIVHALKSTAKMIGASELSENARQMEMDAKQGRLPSDDSYEAIISEYDRIVDGIKSFLGIEEESTEGDGDVMEFGPSGDDEVLEFGPKAADNDVLEFGPSGNDEVLEFNPGSGDDEVLEFGPKAEDDGVLEFDPVGKEGEEK